MERRRDNAGVTVPSWPAASRCAFTVVTLLCFGYAPYHMWPDRGETDRPDDPPNVLYRADRVIK